ncbi:MAG: AAA family ATPase [Firmicutes bacterium]|nr:AAA family ATPase [Bacillota bacterium]
MSKSSTARAQALYFTHIYLENWKNFLHVDRALQRRVFLVGPNASGKSNLLDAFRFLRDLVTVGGGFQEAVRRRGGLSAIRCLAARKQPNVVIRVSIGTQEKPDKWVYELQFTQDNQRRTLVKRERVTRDGEELLSRPNEDDQSDPERLTQTYLEQVNVNKDFRQVVDFFASIRYLHVVPQLVREPERSVGKENDPYGGDFLEQIARTNDKTRKARFQRIREALAVAVPQLKELELYRDVRGTPHLRGKYEHWRPQGAWQDERQLSDGTLRLFGLLWSVLDGHGPLLLEEPELSLHPEVVRHIPQMFARIQRKTGRQLLISTHSTGLLQDEGVGLDEVMLLQPGREGTFVRTATDIQDVESLLDGGVGLDEIVMAETAPRKVEQLALFGDR